jgi:hypothetical protein
MSTIPSRMCTIQARARGRRPCRSGVLHHQSSIITTSMASPCFWLLMIYRRPTGRERGYRGGGHQTVGRLQHMSAAIARQLRHILSLRHIFFWLLGTQFSASRAPIHRWPSRLGYERRVFAVDGQHLAGGIHDSSKRSGRPRAAITGLVTGGAERCLAPSST